MEQHQRFTQAFSAFAPLRLPVYKSREREHLHLQGIIPAQSRRVASLPVLIDDRQRSADCNLACGT